MKFELKSLLFLLLSLSIFVFVGCSEDDDDHHEESQDAHVCEHLTDGPDVDVDAAASIGDAITQADNDHETIIQHVLHTRYDVSLPESAPGTYTGFVVYEPVGEDGDYIIYMDADVSITVYDHTDGDVVIAAEDEEDHSDDCVLVAYKGIYEFHADHRYVIQLGPTTDHPTVSIVIPAMEESDHDHDH